MGCETTSLELDVADTVADVGEVVTKVELNVAAPPWDELCEGVNLLVDERSVVML